MDGELFSRFKEAISRYSQLDEGRYKQLVQEQLKEIKKNNRNDLIVAAEKCSGESLDASYLIRELRRGAAAIEHAMAIHFALHGKEKWRSHADRIDSGLFGEDINSPDLFWRINDSKSVEVDASNAGPLSDDAPQLSLPATPNTDDEETWLNPLNHTAIPLFGREAELKTLSSFLEGDDKFSILAIIGPSGAGKTRLTSEWLLKHVDRRRWNAGFLTDRDPTPWKEWRPNRDTIIVIDYVFQFDDAIRQIMKVSAAKTNHNVRLVILDHIFPSLLNDIPSDPYFNPFAENKKELDARKRLFHPDSPMLLSRASSRSEILTDVIAHVAGEARESVNIGYALTHLRAMGDAACHPLFAALMGEALREGKETRAWARSDLIAYYLESTNRLPWLEKSDPQNNAPDFNGFAIGAFVAAATARGGLNFRSLIANTSHEITKTDENLRRIIARCLRIVADSEKINSGLRLRPFEPDILGESFFIRFCQEFMNHSAFRKWFIDILSAGDDASFNIDAFYSFFFRLSVNLSNDHQSDDAVQSSWVALCDFLDPRYFAQDSDLRKAIAVAISIVALRAIDVRPDIAKKLIIGFSKIDFSIFNEIEPSDYAAYGLAVAAHIAVKTSANIDLDKLFLILTNIYEKAYPGSSIASMHLAFCTRLNLTEAIRPIVPDDFSINDPILDNMNALQIASWYGAYDTADLLIQRGADINWCTHNSIRPLVCACYQQHPRVVRLLLKQEGILFDIPVNAGGITPLLSASHFGDVEIIEALLRKGANPNFLCNLGDNKMSISPLSVASTLGHEAVVNMLLQFNADVNCGESKPLIVAAIAGQTAVVKLLIQNGADAVAALLEMVHMGEAQALRALISATKHVLDRSAHLKALIWACGKGNIEVIACLIDEFGPDVCVEADEEGWTALDVATAENQIRAAVFLLEASLKCGQHLRKSTLRRALTIASGNGHPEIARAILEAGADPNENIKDSIPPLNLACLHGFTKTAAVLLEKGADPNCSVAANNETPLIWAVSGKNHALIHLLLHKAANVDHVCTDGLTPVLRAIGKFDLKALTLLLSRGADTNLITLNEISPLGLSLKTNYMLVSALREYGAVFTATEHDVLKGLLLDYVIDGDVFNAHLILCAGLDPNFAISNTTPLIIACLRNATILVDMLLEYGADPSASVLISDGDDSEHSLNESGTNFNVLNVNGKGVVFGDVIYMSPLIAASVTENTEIQEKLIDAGADRREIQGITILDLDQFP